MSKTTTTSSTTTTTGNASATIQELIDILGEEPRSISLNDDEYNNNNNKSSIFNDNNNEEEEEEKLNENIIMESSFSDSNKFNFCIDRGGTFTDVYADIPKQYQKIYGKSYGVMKLLSVDSAYADAPTEGIRRILEQATGNTNKYNPKAVVPSDEIGFIRMGTTVATNALLERKGEPCALLITKGFRDVLHIGNQSRPDIFDLKISRLEVLYTMVVEIDERVRIRKFVLDESLPRDAEIVKGSTEEEVWIEKKPSMEGIVNALQEITKKGIKSIAVAFLHSYTYDQHEQMVKKIALDPQYQFTFNNISLSSDLMSKTKKIVPRGHTTCADAYLTPCIQEYLQRFMKGFDANFEKNVRVSFMQSDGGLCLLQNFSGYRAVLSGPAGGVVGYVQTTQEHYSKKQAVIGFDMGGTSTDVSRYGGEYELVFENTTAGITIQAPQLDINTVASGGGSCLLFENGMLKVGPESAGADPGPVCYKKKGGKLAVTDANLMLGRIVPEYFPKIFGENRDEILGVEETKTAFLKITKEINEYEKNTNPENYKEKSMAEVAMGFVEVANETMCRPIRNLTEAKGYNTTQHVLATFGGAGGQHACAMARALGIHQVFIHRFSGILSAVGMGLADVVRDVQAAYVMNLTPKNMAQIQERLYEVCQVAKSQLQNDGFSEKQIIATPYLNLRFDGTDNSIFISGPLITANLRSNQISSSDLNKLCTHYQNGFIEKYRQEYGFVLDRHVVIDDVRARGVAIQKHPHKHEIPTRPENEPLQPNLKDWKTWFDLSGIKSDKSESNKTSDSHGKNKKKFQRQVEELNTPVYLLSKLYAGDSIAGPALILQDTSTIVVEPSCHAEIDKYGNVVITIGENEPKPITTERNPIQLAIFGHRFMSIAEQMGRTLQRTSVSTNIKERLDFSCAIFGPDGGLVANAPHLPVHLGSMQEAVRYQTRKLQGNIQRGDVLASNHPIAGGTHLPDITVMTPVFHNSSKDPVFWVASRGHHADIGGITPGSMPPFSVSLAQEGAAIESIKLVKQGTFMEDDITKILTTPSDAQSTGTRNLSNNLSDLKAQIAANQKGIGLMENLIDEYSLAVVQAYMYHIQDNAEEAVRDMLKRASMNYRKKQAEKKTTEAKENKQDQNESNQVVLKAIDYMDDGTPIPVSVSINEKDGSAIFDFTGVGPMVYGNCNAPKVVTYSAIIYCMRCLVDLDIPLNQGCLKPIQVLIPDKTILTPSPEAAIVGGNVLTSQRVTDVILKAFNACAASQGCMNNLTFGDKSFGYYETIAGGSGAGPTWNGQSGVHTHMTNTRITDPEILETRYPVVLRTFGLRPESGGKGKYRGGDGCLRFIEVCKPLHLSILSERRTYKPYGLNGGKPGACGLNLIRRAKDGAYINIGSKRTYEAQTGDIIMIHTPGGGGWGKPTS